MIDPVSKAVITVRADKLCVGDEIQLDNGSYVQVRAVNCPGSDWNPNTTVVKIRVGGAWVSWPVEKLVAVIE